MRKTILTIILFIIIAFNNVFSDSWQIMHENPGGPAIHDGALIDGFKLLVAVGDSGWIYRVSDDGLWEQSQAVANTNNLLDIDLAYNSQSNTTILFAVGTNGTIIRSLDSSMTWQESNQGAIRLNAVKYSSYTNEVYAGGDGGRLIYSNNFGNTWNTVNLPDPGIDIKGFIDAGSNGFFLYGIKNDSTFILKNMSLKSSGPGGPSFSPHDTIPDEIVTSSYYSFGGMGQNIYFCGTDPINTVSHIFKKTYNGTAFDPAVMVYSGLPAGASTIDGYETFDYKTIMWVAGDNWIYKSNGNDNTWQNVYTIQDRTLNAVIANAIGFESGDYAFALGGDQLFLKYGFNLDWIQPDQNEQIDYGLDNFRLFFSSPANLQSVESGIQLNSSVSGNIPLSVNYDQGDSNIIVVDYGRGPIPGEHLSFDVIKPIRAKEGSNDKLFHMSRDLDVLSLVKSEVKFLTKFKSMPLGKQTTNFLSGFFNEDDIFDLITFSDDTLFCYAGNDTNGFDNVVSIPTGTNLSVLPSINTQLLKYDINNDGKMDIVIFDDNNINILENTSYGADFNFSLASAELSITGVSDLFIDDFDMNGDPDILGLSNSQLFMLYDVKLNQMPSVTNITPLSNYKILRVGDIDRDGWLDIAVTDKQNSLQLLRGAPNKQFGLESSSITGQTFIDMQLADVNKDGLMEIIALRNDNSFKIYRMNPGNGWDFILSNNLPYTRSDTLKYIVIQDFGGHLYNNNVNRLMDIAAVTNNNRLVIYENWTNALESIVFAQDTSAMVSTSINPNGLAFGDFNKDAVLDPVVFNKAIGTFETTAPKGSEWKPTILFAQVSGRDSILLRWNSLPPEMGALQFYNVRRDTSTDISPDSPFFKQYFVYDTVLTDDEAYGEFRNYWYTVTAVYGDDNTFTLPSDPVYVQKFIPLNGDVYGKLNNSLKPYLADSTIVVPVNESLVIGANVKIAFEPDARFEVYGNLQVLGDSLIENGGDQLVGGAKALLDNSAPKYMAHFFSANYESKWKGIFLHSASDTVIFKSFNIEGAETAIHSESRPLKLKMGGIQKSDTAVYVSQDSLYLQNMIFDSNRVAMVLGDGTRSFIKNIDIFNSETAGIVNEFGSNTLVKNSIIWDNNENSIINKAYPENLWINYSTVDTVISSFSGYDNKKEAPIFMPPDSGYFRMAAESPTIDAGDPADDFSMEPMPNGGRINQGVYGGTQYATRSKPQWQPTINYVYVNNDNSVELSWTEFPQDLGSLQYYQIVRDTTPNFNENSDFYRSFQSTEPSFTDRDAFGASEYWYAVNAVFDDNKESLWSAPAQVVLRIKIGGDISGVLERQDTPYLIESYLRVPQDSSLIINPGVIMYFSPQAYFDVEGRMEVKGAPFDPQGEVEPMVSFRSQNGDEGWKGMHIFPAADTVRFTWFNIENARIGIFTDGRPVELGFGGITHCDTALIVNNDSLFIHNINFDSNKVAIELQSGTRSLLKNINIVNSEESGFNIENGSKALVKNSILWNNNNNSVVSKVGNSNDLFISYSTIDTIGGMHLSNAILRTPPIFMPPDSGCFRPAYDSPTIDAGDPADDFSMEPMPNGGRINQGLFGGTPYATRSITKKINLVFEPPQIVFNTAIDSSDTLDVTITNISDEDISIYSVYIKNNTPEFHLLKIDSILLENDGDLLLGAGDNLFFPIVFSPTENRQYSDFLEVESNDPVARFQNIPIEGNVGNRPPVLTKEYERLFGGTNEEFQHTVPVYDPDGDTLSYFIQNGPEWLNVNENGVLSGTPTASDTGYSHVDVEISDRKPGGNVYYHADIEIVSADRILQGSVTGALDSAKSPYYVRSDIYVPDGNSLIIGANTDLRFMPDLQLDVYGSLTLDGAFDDIIEFQSIDEDSFWKGIKIHPGADTLRLKGFIISNCDTALRVQNRPLNLSYFAMGYDSVAAVMNNTSAKIKNLYIDTVGTGLIINNSNVDIKNITLTNALFSGINVNTGSDVKVRNAILWNNPISVLSDVTADHLSLRYSTIDNIQGVYDGFEISNLAPVINMPDDGPSLIAPSSPTIDAGDPADDYNMEPQPNGSRINQGAFGGTNYATRSFQGRIIISPDTLETSAYPGESDTLYISVSNAGGAELEISAVNFAKTLPAFTILADAPPYSVAPADDIIIPVLFRPENRAIYLDTLVFTTNDPHYLKGQKIVPISGIGLNHAPIIIGNAPQKVRVENEYYYKIRVFDAENDPLSFSPVQMPSWLSLSDSGAISGTPALSDTGVNHVEVSINDGHGGTAAFVHDILVWISDDYPPNITITSRPPTEVRESAVHFEFFADDTSGYLVGDDPELLYIHYRLISLSDKTIINEADSVKKKSATFYPLDDGNYEFQIWAYDTHGNGLHGLQNKETARFKVASSEVNINRYRWYMVSFPRSRTFSLKQLNDDSTAIILRWSNEENGYLPPKNFEVSMGEAFWIQSFKPYHVDLSEYKQTSIDDTIFTSIEAGWNQIGIPLGYKVNWDEMEFISDSTGQRYPLIDVLESNAVYWYIQNKKFQGYTWEKPDTALALPWRGYWIKSSQKGTLLFPKSPAIRIVQSVNDSLGSLKKSTLEKVSISNWQLNLTLSNENYIDDGNIIGISNNKSDDIIYEPPHFDEFCSLYFSDAKGRLTQKLKECFKSYEDVISWNFQVKTSESGKTHLLKWDNELLNKLSLYVYLIDPENEKIINMDNENTYTFTPGKSKKTFKIYATQDASFKPQIIPLEFKLLQNYPNPFNPSTTIRFGVPESLNNQKITVKVFDVLGREIATLLNEKVKMGYHKVKWNGKNSSNIPAASGIYFYQVKGGSQLLVKKMVLIR